MELNEEQLKEKAFSLMRCERELFDLRMKHEQVTLWLQLTQALPQLFDDPRATVNDTYARFRKALIAGLRWQRALFFELREQTLVPIVPAGAPRSLTPASLELLSSDAAGFYNEPSPNDSSPSAGADLAEALGLARFTWSRIEVPGRLPVILAAGFDRAKAKFQANFDASDAAHLRNATQHAQGLIRNALLVHELERERDRLQQSNQSLEQRDRELHALTEDLRAANDTLEQRVRQRTEELGRRNRDMRLVLDHVVQGLVTLDAAGRLARERSARIDDWFGSYEGNPSFIDYVTRLDPAFAERFALMHEALIEGIMPADICLAQLPSQLRVGARTFACSYRPLAENASGAGLLVMIDDITETLRLRQEDAEQSELLAFFQWLMRDRDGFLSFFSEASFLVVELTGGALDEPTRRRHLHTLKGNAAMHGAKILAELCHRAEDQLEMDGPAGAEATIQRLGARWAAIKQTLAMVAAERGERVVEIPSRVLERLCDEIDRGMSVHEIAHQLTFLRFEPVARPFERLAAHARVLAQRMGRAELSIVVEASDTRVDPRRFGRLWAALVHVLRNAIDHGIEPPVERLSRGKSPQGRLSLRSSHATQELTIEIEDDGRGIDWDRVRQIAEARGLPHRSHGDLLSALLSDGFSTKSGVTETSGRGVGMSAVHAQVLELGGRLSVTSNVGVGSCWTIVLPVAAANGLKQVISGQDSSEREPKSRQACG